MATVYRSENATESLSRSLPVHRCAWIQAHGVASAVSLVLSVVALFFAPPNDPWVFVPLAIFATQLVTSAWAGIREFNARNDIHDEDGVR